MKEFHHRSVYGDVKITVYKLLKIIITNAKKRVGYRYNIYATRCGATFILDSGRGGGGGKALVTHNACPPPPKKKRHCLVKLCAAPV